MKRTSSGWVWLVAFSLVLSPLAWAASAAKPAASAADRSPVASLATAVTTVTGIAISPLLGTGVYGAYQWVAAKDDAARAVLPWYAQWSFFGPALLIVGLCAAKDAMGAALPPGFKKPLDVLETIENKASGLVAAGAVVPFTMDALSKMVAGGHAGLDGSLAPDSLAMIQVAAVDGSSFLNLLTVPFGIAMFALVWMASHAINVLIILSPWGAVDAALKATRTGLLGLLTLSATINPWAGAVLSLLVIVVAWLVAGWAFRLTVFGSVFCWDFLTGRSGRFVLQESGNAMFAGGNFPGVPVRTYGRLMTGTAGESEFVYRPWLCLPERRVGVPVPAAQLAVGRGLFFSTITTEQAGTLFLLPPRYRGHEEALVRSYGLGGVREAGLRKAWSVLRELFGGGAAKTQVV